MHLHRYEKIWLGIGIGTLIIFLVVLGFGAFVLDNHPPSHMTTIDPKLLDKTPPFDQPGLVKLAENKYQANIIAMAFGYKPNKIEVPLGATVVFQVSSKDVVHSFTIPKTNVNMMIVPGHINQATHTFTEKGSYLVLCNEYCGSGHQHMQMRIEVVE